MNQTVLRCCAVCNTKTQRRCAQCLCVYYCNREHQKQDWRRHKSECLPNLVEHLNTDQLSAISLDTKKGKDEINAAEVLEKIDIPKPEGSASNQRRSKKSKKKSTNKTGGVSVSDKQTSLVSTQDNIVKKQNEIITSDIKPGLSGDSVISSVVYKNTDLNKEAAITYEGSSEKEILSESGQQLNAEDFAMASTSNMMRPQQTDFALPSSTVYGSGHSSKLKEYPEASLKGVTGNPFPSNYSMDPNDPYYNICNELIRDMTQYGVCVMDNFLRKERGLKVLNEVLDMYEKGIFTAGQTMTRPGRSASRTVRSDRITWVDGKDPTTPNIRHLISQVDNIVLRANKMANNGKMGDYIINNRTMAMVACYPGSGTHYVTHVDNPNKDGRCITAIYYLNLDWDITRHGGLLRVFPEGASNVADIAPIFDRMLFFWSDRRNPHEVQPSYNTRYAITLWYFDAPEREQALRRIQAQRQL